MPARGAQVRIRRKATRFIRFAFRLECLNLAQGRVAAPASTIRRGSLRNPAEAPALFFAPFVSSIMRAEAHWIDYNGHLNAAYYNVFFDRAVDEAFGLVGLGPDYVEERKASFFVVESHIRYRRELRENDPVRVTLQLLAFDDKRIHYFMELHHATEGWLAASCENLSLHVDMTTRKVAPFPPDILANLAVMRTAHARLPHPQDAGKAIAMPRRGEDEPEPQLAAGTRH